MTSFRMLVTILSAGIGLMAVFYFVTSGDEPTSPPKVHAPILNPTTPSTPAKSTPSSSTSSEPHSSHSEHNSPSEPSSQGTSAAEPDASLTMKIFLPKGDPRRNGFLVLTPREWRADQDAAFNPLLAKYKAPWSTSLRKPHDETLVIEGLPKGSYQIFLYRNDGGDNVAPTRVLACEISSGGFCNIDASALDKLDPIK